MRHSSRGAIAVAAVALALHIGGCTSDETVRPSRDAARAFFKGKTLTYVVATDAGGGYDTYGRLVAKYLARQLQMDTVVVKNISGGGHIRGAHAIFTANPDGLTQGTFNTGVIYAQLIGRKGLPVDLRRMSWIGKAGLEPRVLTVSAKAGVRSLDDIRRGKKRLLLGTNGVGNESYYDSLLLAHALGLRVRMVFGLGAREAQLSMMRGEIDGEVGSASSYRPFVRNGYGHTVLRVGRSAEVDDNIPNAADQATTAEGKAIIELMEALTVLLRWTVGPPGIPEERLAVLRDAYMSALGDSGLLAEARKLDIPIVPMDGATLAREVDRLLTQPLQTVAMIGSIVNADPER
jgi:tripartite-type tricarboxylate transporter receptor subunit TctC